MARWPKAAPVYDVANAFRQRCLLEGRSLLWPQQKVWTPTNLSRLRDSSSKVEAEGFLGKWREQLTNDPPEIHRIAADVLAFYWLCPTNVGPDTKLEQIKEVVSWKLVDAPPDYSILEEAFKTGFANPGPKYLISRNDQITFYLAFANEILAGRGDPRDPHNSKRLADVLIHEIKNSRPARHVLLHLLFPDLFESIASTSDKKKIVKAFHDFAGGASDLDDALSNIRRKLEQDYGREISFYSDREIRHQWKPKEEKGKETEDQSSKPNTVPIKKHEIEPKVGTHVFDGSPSSSINYTASRRQAPMDIIPDKRKIVSLVEQAFEGKLCLPDFQRDFVWRRDEVADLVRSIVRGYFIGTLLLLRCNPQDPPFAPIFLRGAKPLLQEPRAELLVLDGQQRLSALLYALTAPDLDLKDSTQRRWFFLDLNVLLEDPDSDGIVFDRSKRELDGLDQRGVQYARRVLPCTSLHRSRDFMAWRDGLDDWLREQEPEKHRLFREEWRDPWTKVVNDFQNFEVPLVELPQVTDSDPDSIGRVCAIFEKLNSTGVELSVYDLLTARLYRNGIRLHDLWDEACREHKLLATWSERKADTHSFGVLVLRTLSLLRGLEVRPRFLINLRPENFERDWRRATLAIERALSLLTLVGPDGFGVFDRKWLPGFGLLPVLAALRANIEERRLGEGPRSDLRRWYWCNVFLERYSSAVESKSRKDYAEVTSHWLEGHPEPTVFAEARAGLSGDGYSIRDAGSYSSTIYSGVFCLLALCGARDWTRGEAIQLQTLEDHHIFPQAYLKRHGVAKKTEVNTIVNRTLLSDETNNKIKDRAPADYIRDERIIPSELAEARLLPHFLGHAALDAMRQASDSLSNPSATKTYEDFLGAREKAIVSEIRKICGISLKP